MSKFCQTCQAEAADDHLFCSVCGTKFPEKASPAETINAAEPAREVLPIHQSPYVPPTPPVYQASAPAAMPEPESTRGRGLGIASLILGIIGIVFSFIVYFITLTFDYFSPGALLCTTLFSFFPTISLAFAIVSKACGYRGGQATAGLVTSIIGSAFIFLSFFINITYLF